MGLTILPKLTKKTWADIASESDDDSEIYLQTMIQNTKKSKTIVNPKGKLTLAVALKGFLSQNFGSIYKTVGNLFL